MEGMSEMRVSQQRTKNKPKSKALKPKCKQKKSKRGNSNIIKGINSRVNSFFEKSNLNEIAKKTGYLIRNAPITPFIFIYALSMGFYGVNISLDMLAINMNSIFSTDLTGSAFSIRMGEQKSVLYLKSCFEKFLTIQLDSAFNNKFHGIFAMFKGVLLEDSTVIELNERVSKALKGSGGAASKSSVKLNWVFNICSYAAVAVDIFSGSTPDRKNSKKSLKHIKRGMLIVRDLGYFVIGTLRMIAQKGAYYLSRIPKGTFLYLNENETKPLDIQSFFKEVTRGNRSIKIPIFIGKEERFSTNLILQKVPNWVLKQRVKRFKKKNSGRSPSDDFITWAKYSVYITNIPDKLVTINDDDFNSIEILIMEIYKIRWQIEILFKKFKSKIKLNIIRGKNKNSVLSLIYGKLISILLSLMVLSYAASENHNSREISLWKVTSWLISEGRLAKAILNGTLGALYCNLCKQFKLLCKDRRKRNTALEELEKAFQWERMAA
jgi:hypothetical protein